ncbi:hypothetical protein DERF_009614 [Dermatophagoides farinae]|uniref:Uncharacterized protein n=1 Tax=Dermatophagoides farinae TaxID=6954 RepID=A0A922HUE4_DERFA|nr:hypothetical protein DERF_009614 [Dermatophagoides farinae]
MIVMIMRSHPQASLIESMNFTIELYLSNILLQQNRFFRILFHKICCCCQKFSAKKIKDFSTK